MSTIQTANIYVTTDGKKFEDQGAAIAHQSDLENGARVDAFLDQFYPVDPNKVKQGPTRAIARRAILTWLGSQGDQAA